MALVDPELNIEEEQRFIIYDQLRTSLDVLTWFKLDISEYEMRLKVRKGRAIYSFDVNGYLWYDLNETHGEKMLAPRLAGTVQRLRAVSLNYQNIKALLN